MTAIYQLIEDLRKDYVTAFAYHTQELQEKKLNEYVFTLCLHYEQFTQLAAVESRGLLECEKIVLLDDIANILNIVFQFVAVEYLNINTILSLMSFHMKNHAKEIHCKLEKGGINNA